MSSRPEEALSVLEVSLALHRRYWSHDEENILSVQANLANCLDALGRDAEALVLRREVHDRHKTIYGVSHEVTIGSGSNLCVSLDKLGYWKQSKPLLRNQCPRLDN